MLSLSLLLCTAAIPRIYKYLCSRTYKKKSTLPTELHPQKLVLIEDTKDMWKQIQHVIPDWTPASFFPETWSYVAQVGLKCTTIFRVPSPECMESVSYSWRNSGKKHPPTVSAPLLYGWDCFKNGVGGGKESPETLREEVKSDHTALIKEQLCRHIGLFVLVWFVLVVEFVSF